MGWGPGPTGVGLIPTVQSQFLKSEAASPGLRGRKWRRQDLYLGVSDSKARYLFFIASINMSRVTTVSQVLKDTGFLPSVAIWGVTKPIQRQQLLTLANSEDCHRGGAIYVAIRKGLGAGHVEKMGKDILGSGNSMCRGTGARKSMTHSVVLRCAAEGVGGWFG